MNRLFFAIVFTAFAISVSCQPEFGEYEKKLARYNDYFVNADQWEHRKAAHDNFKPLFESTLKKDSSFYYPFDSLKWISKLIPPDSSFRVFSWQLTKSDSINYYFGYLQKKDGRLYELKDNKEFFSDLEYEVFTNDDWYGQLYYNLYSYRNRNKNEYILFGYKRLNKYDKIKIAAPVFFEDGNVYFGKEVFQDTLRQGGLKNRVILETANEAASKLNYDEDLGIIIYDHTIIIPLKRPSWMHPPMVPDGSYHGYKWDGEKWKFINKVFNQKYDKNSIPGRIKRNK